MSGIDTATALALACALTNARIDVTEEPRPGDLVVERTSRRVDPDAIGWLIAHDVAPYNADDPLDGSVPMREVWDVLPLNPDAKLQTIVGESLQRWENAQFVKVPDHVVTRIGLECPFEPHPKGQR